MIFFYIFLLYILHLISKRLANIINNTLIYTCLQLQMYNIIHHWPYYFASNVAFCNFSIMGETVTGTYWECFCRNR